MPIPSLRSVQVSDLRNFMKTILVVDDEPKITQLVRDYLERAGFGVLVAYDGKKALSLAKTEKPDMVVLDLGLPQLDGLDFTREFRKASTDVEDSLRVDGAGTKADAARKVGPATESAANASEDQAAR